VAINADKPHLWKEDTETSVDFFNNWFMRFAPKAYRDTRIDTTKEVKEALRVTNDLATITHEVLKSNPAILPTLRMATCPPLARDRLSGLAHAGKSLVKALEHGKLPARMPTAELDEQLRRLADIILRMLDTDIFPWLDKGRTPSSQGRHRASTIVADRLCGSVSDPIIRNAQEKRQFACIARYLNRRGYKRKAHPPSKPLKQMEPGTFSF